MNIGFLTGKTRGCSSKQPRLGLCANSRALRLREARAGQHGECRSDDAVRAAGEVQLQVLALWSVVGAEKLCGIDLDNVEDAIRGRRRVAGRGDSRASAEDIIAGAAGFLLVDGEGDGSWIGTGSIGALLHQNFGESSRRHADLH